MLRVVHILSSPGTQEGNTPPASRNYRQTLPSSLLLLLYRSISSCSFGATIPNGLSKPKLLSKLTFLSATALCANVQTGQQHAATMSTTHGSSGNPIRLRVFARLHASMQQGPMLLYTRRRRWQAVAVVLELHLRPQRRPQRRPRPRPPIAQRGLRSKGGQVS